MVAAGADDVDGVVALVLRERHDLARRQHGVEQAGQLLGALALGAQGDDEADQLSRRGVARQDRAHRRPRLVGRQVMAFQQQREQTRPPAVLVDR